MSIVEYFVGTPQEKKALKKSGSIQSQAISRRLFLRRVAASGTVAAVAATPVVYSLLKGGNPESNKNPNPERSKSFRDRVSSFTWERAEGARLESFTNDLADKYLELTRTSRVTKQELMATHFFHKSEDYLQAIRVNEPNFNEGESNWGYTHYPTRQVYIDVESLKRQLSRRNQELGIDSSKSAGDTLLGGLWHEWTRLDVTERQTGRFINSPEAFFDSPFSGKREAFKRYRGGTIYTDTYFGFVMFESVWNNSIVIRRITEQVGMDFAVAAGNYYKNGTDVLVPFTRTAGISLDTLYQMHATSDFEGFMQLVGQKLPGNSPALVKGNGLFIALHKRDPQLIQETGIYSVIGRR